MPTLDERIKADVLEAMKLTRKYFVVELDFTDRSIRDMEELFELADVALPGGKSQENVDKMSRLWGVYVGEYLRRRCGGRWAVSEAGEASEPVLRGERGEVRPGELIRARLAGQSQETVWDYCQRVRQTL